MSFSCADSRDPPVDIHDIFTVNTESSDSGEWYDGNEIKDVAVYRENVNSLSKSEMPLKLKKKNRLGCSRIYINSGMYCVYIF